MRIAPWVLRVMAARSAGPFSFAGSHRLPGHGLLVHRHRLVDYEPLRIGEGPDAGYLTLYRDEAGKIAYLSSVM